MAAADIGMWELDLETDNAAVCETAAKLLGLRPRPHLLQGNEWRSLILRNDLKHVESQIKHTCQYGNKFNVEFRVEHRTGNVVWLQSKGEIKKDTEGHATHILGMTLDITDRKNAETALKESEARFRLLADASPDAIFVNCGGRYVYANAAAATLMGASHPRKLVKLRPEDFVDPVILQSMRESVQQQLEHRTTSKPFTIRFRRLDGNEGVAEVTYGRITWKGEDALQILVRDVTELRETEEKLRVMNERLKLAVIGTGEGIWDGDLVAGTYELSGGVREILGYPDEEMPKSGEEWRRLIHPEDRQRVEAAFLDCASGKTSLYRCEYRVRAYDGSWKWVSSRGVAVQRDERGAATLMTGTMTDITARRESEEVVWRHANLDPLTGLPNRRHFISNLKTKLRVRHRAGDITALLFIDLDGFKQVNDVFGHEAGDLLLMEASYRIHQTIREEDCLARLGGDEFTIMLKDLPDQGRVEFVCQDILARLSQPFAIHNEYAYISASIGVALAPMDGTTADELLRKADTAMYSAKTAGKNQFSYFAQAMDDRAHMRVRVSTELRGAIARNQLSLCYQPVIDLHTGRVCKTEALLRWEHPKLGNVPPSVFVPIAEETGLMAEIGNWVFHEAAAKTKQWGESIGCPCKVALNKSPVQFSRRQMESDWLAYLHELDLPPSSIVVEITEGLLLHANDEVSNKLLEYRDAGIQVAIDDFGTGYSSMAYLQKFDIDYLKIDQSFIRSIPHDTGHCTIVETIIVMAHKLGQMVIAEGIETKEQVDFLIRAGCDYGQGFYFSPPLSPDKVETALSRCYL